MYFPKLNIWTSWSFLFILSFIIFLYFHHESNYVVQNYEGPNKYVYLFSYTSRQGSVGVRVAQRTGADDLPSKLFVPTVEAIGA
jgi:hypothetical protein